MQGPARKRRPPHGGSARARIPGCIPTAPCGFPATRAGRRWWLRESHGWDLAPKQAERAVSLFSSAAGIGADAKAFSVGEFAVYDVSGGFFWGYIIALVLFLVALGINIAVVIAPAKSDETLEQERLAKAEAKAAKERENELKKEKEREEAAKAHEEEQKRIIEEAKRKVAEKKARDEAKKKKKK